MKNTQIHSAKISKNRENGYVNVHYIKYRETGKRKWFADLDDFLRNL